MRRKPHNPYRGASSDDVAVIIAQLVVALALAGIACLAILQ